MVNISIKLKKQYTLVIVHSTPTGGIYMSDVCGKHFNPTIPSNAEKIEEEFKYVNLCVYITPSSLSTEAKICETINKASKIWCNNCKIILNVNGVKKLDNDDQLTDQELSVEELEQLQAEDITSADELDHNETAAKLVNHFQPIPCTSEPFIIVYYIGGEKFQSGEDGFARFFLTPDRYVIVLTDKARAEVLAHEVGHILFSHHQNGNDPDNNRDPDDKIHNRSRKNLMHPSAPDVNEPIVKDPQYITEAQCEVASSNPLVQEKMFEVGFKTKIFTYQILFTDLHVWYSDDGPFGNYDLEATFTFTVNDTNSQWKSDVDYVEFSYNPNIILNVEIEENPADTIDISVTGQDHDDLNDPDIFPKLERSFGINENWGTNLPANVQHSLHSNRTEDIEYSVRFMITKIGSRDKDVVRFDNSNFCFKERG